MRHLTKEQLLVELRRRPGLVPIEIETHTRQLKWLDLETYHFYEGFLHKGLNNFATLKRARSGRSLESFASELDVLEDQQILVDAIYPTGFIFHAGRCGSTLLSRILARDRRHLVVSEAASHNLVWLALTNNGKETLLATEANQQVYKNLVLAMGRKRLPGHEAHFIKFTSFNILFFNFIRSVFPDVPAIFLYRRPLEILNSYETKPPGWFHSSQETLRLLLAKATPDGWEATEVLRAPADAVAAFFTAALGAGRHGLRYLNYAELVPGNLPFILEALNVSATTKQLTTMESQFRLDSKVDHRASGFVSQAHLRTTAPIDEQQNVKLKALYNQLLQSDFNVASPGFAASEGLE